MDAWKSWFASKGDKLVDGGSPFGSGREITLAGTKELSLDNGAITGHFIIYADSIDEVEEIAKECPIISSVRVYEAMSM
jgi:hypothetical protein